MRKAPLSTAIAKALFVAGMTTAMPVVFSNTAAANDVSQIERRPIHVRYFRLSLLADNLAATGDSPATATVTGARQGHDPLIGWVPAETLSTEEARAKVAALVRSGTGVIVSGKPGASRYEAKAFGIQGSGSTNLYLPRPDGTLDVHSTNASVGMDRSGWQFLAEQARKAYDTPTSTINADEDPKPIGPSRRYVTWVASPANNGAAIGMDITLVHDSTENGNQKILMIKTRASAVPFRNGLTMSGWPDASKDYDGDFQYHGSNYMLYTVDNYRMITRVSGGAPTATKQYPKPSSATEMSFTESQEKTTSFNWSLGAEFGANLSSKGIESLGKMLPKANGSRKVNTINTMSMKVKDYSTDMHVTKNSGYTQVAWTYMLAPFIRGNGSYFNNGAYLTPITKTTPMMRSADLEGYSEWSFDGDSKADVTIVSAVEIDDEIRSPWYSTRVTTDWPQKQYEALITRDSEFLTYQPVSRITLSLDTPEVVRYPIVELQNVDENGACLQASSSSNDVSLAHCGFPQNSPALQQWQYDVYGRYVNRGNGKCLASVNGVAVAVPCSMDVYQQWTWQADRIHLLNDIRHRLYVHGSKAYTGFDETTHKLWPINANNPLLPPWNNYPLASFAGDLIPGFANITEVPANYSAYGKVGTDERWIAIPIVLGTEVYD